MSHWRALEIATGPVLGLGGTTALWQAAQQLPVTVGGGNELLSAGLFVSAIITMGGAIGLLYREGRKATEAASANLNTAHAAHVHSIELLHRDLLASKDEVLAAKDQTIRSLEDRCGVLDNRVVSTGQEYQATIHTFMESMAEIAQHLEELTQAVATGASQSVTEHQEMIRALRGELAPKPPRRRHLAAEA